MAEVKTVPARARAFLPAWLTRSRPVVPVVRLSGAIGSSRLGMSLASVETALARAFSMKRAPAVAIVINSPGGAPTQSHLIHRRIRALAAEKDKRVVVAVEDVAASGGYLIALAGDEIVADASSIVGSIGVVSAGFGFTGLIDRIGVERRVHTAGTSKAMLDPFRPEKEEEVARLKAIQNDVYEDFVALVKERRGEALADDPDIFTGAFWTGRRAKELGLIDTLGDLRTLLHQRYGEDVRLKRIATQKRRFLPGVRLAADHDIGDVVDDAAAALEERALRSRYGL